MAVGEQLFQKCHRKFESSLVCMMIAVVEIRYLLLDGNWKAMTLQEVFGMVCTWHFSTYRIRKKVSSTFYRFVLCWEGDKYDCTRVFFFYKRKTLCVMTLFYGCVYFLQRTLLLSLKHHIFVVLWLLPLLCHLMTF